MPLVPGVNDDAENLDAVARFLVGHEIAALRFVPYHRLYLDKYASLGLEAPLRGVEPPSAETLARAVERLSHHGVVVEVDG